MLLNLGSFLFWCIKMRKKRMFTSDGKWLFFMGYSYRQSEESGKNEKE